MNIKYWTILHRSGPNYTNLRVKTYIDHSEYEQSFQSYKQAVLSHDHEISQMQAIVTEVFEGEIRSVILYTHTKVIKPPRELNIKVNKV